MANTDVFEVASWNELSGGGALWSEKEPCVMIIPEAEEKQRVAAFFKGLDKGCLYTIPELMERFAVISLGKKGLVSRHGMESIIGSIISSGIVPYLHMEKYRQGYVRALTDFIYNFRRTSLVDLQTAFSTFTLEQSNFKEKDLVRIYNEYEKRLGEYGFDLKSTLEHFLNHVAANRICRQFGLEEGTQFVFFGFTYLTMLEAEFACTISEYAPRTVYLLCTDEAAAEQSLRVQQSLSALLKRVYPLQVKELTAPTTRHAYFFRDLGQALFQGEMSENRTKKTASTKSHPKTSLRAEEVVINKENNRYAEVTAIARRIRELLNQNAVPDRMRVVAPEYDLYSIIIGEVFPDYGIPYKLEQGMPILHYPLARVINALIGQATNPNPFPLRDMILSSPYISFQAVATPEALMEFQKTAGVTMVAEEVILQKSGPEGFTRVNLDFSYTKTLRLKAYRKIRHTAGIHQLTVLCQYLNSLKGKVAADTEEMLYTCLLQFFVLSQAEKSLSVWRSRMSSNEFKEAVLTLLQRFQVEENIRLTGRSDNTLAEPSMEQLIEERDQHILKEIHNLLDVLNYNMALLANSGIVSEKSAARFALPELIRVFTRLMDEARFDAAYPTQGKAAVSIEPVRQGHYAQWDYNFVCGMVDGEFPAREEFNFLQPKKDGLGLGLAYTSVDHERNRFYHLVRSTAKGFYVSMPVSHNGRMLTPSPFIQELKRWLPATAGTEDQEQSMERGDFSRELFSRREKMTFIGKNVDENYEKALPLLQELWQLDQPYCRQLTDIMRFDGLTLSTTAFSEYDGLFPESSPDQDKEESSLELLSKAVARLTFTPEVLERYAACPLRFFFDDILCLKQETDYHLDTTERGVLIRSLLKEYTQLAALAGGVPGDGEKMLRERIIRYFEEQENLAVDAFEARFQKQLLAGLEESAARRPGLFAAFLALEKNPPDRLRPFLSNLAGTLSLSDELAVELEIDRVDLAEARNALLLYQYSVAHTGDISKIFMGLRFDLPLALLFFLNYAMQNLPDQEVAGAGVYLVKSFKQIRRGGYLAKETIRSKRQHGVSDDCPIFSGQREGFLKDDEFIAILDQVKEQALRLHRLMQQGIFHLPLCSEGDQSCANCTFSRACRKEQLRLDRLWYALHKNSNLHVVKLFAE